MTSSSQLSFASIELQDLSIPHQVRVDPFSGAATVSVEIPLTPGRANFQPALGLAYSSAARNSVFGVGWSLSGLPSIGLSFKDGLPKYDGTDKYAFGGAELVPWLERDGETPQVFEDEDRSYWIHLYRSKVEGGYLRFEKWVHQETQHIHWRLRDRNGTLSIFGLVDAGTSRIADPENESRTLQWLLEAQYDLHGNAIRYEYLPETADNVSVGTSYERERILGSQGFAQRYLKRIRYGNRRPLAPDDPDPPDDQWHFEVVLDYGEHASGDIPAYVAGTVWPARPDPFSNYRGGFEIRTYRLCRKILMFHRFPELGTGPTLVGALHLEHRQDVAGSTLEQMTYTGYRRDLETDTYTHKTLPPLVFHYSESHLGQTFLSAPEQTYENAPYGVGGLNYRWIDLYGEGLPGILFESHQAWYYKSNLGDGRLGPQHKVLDKPAIRLGEYSISDFDGDGNLNLVVLQGRQAGYYEYNRDDGQWTGFQTFAAAPHVKALDVNTQLIDLNGDGRADIVTVKQDRLTWYPSKGKEGFAAPIELAKPLTNGRSQVPTVGANPNLDYFFADMTGDGLPDQVRIVNGRVEYWPQMGHGQFGPGVVMADAPQLDFDGAFDAGRVRLMDLDGSGTADLLYIGRGEIKYWINASGNRFVEGGTIRGLPYIDNLSSAQGLDFLADGTPCLVWSTALSNQAHAPIQYLRLTGGVKPRLLQSVENSMGQETLVTYGHSASHYLRDQAAGQPWNSKLPQHVTVVDRLEVIDHIGHTRAQSLYAYHDGFFDGEERAFRGFALVDQYDSETYRGTSLVPETDYSDPVCVRTWFHNGAPGWEARRSRTYYQGDPQADPLPAEQLDAPGELASDEYLEAFRALVGQTIRTEVYGLNRAGARQADPYQVTQNRYLVRRLQPKRKDDDPCFTVIPQQSLSFIYEQQAADPRISHSLTLAVDNYGNVTQTCTVAYPRRSAHRTDIEAQARPTIEVAQAEFANIDEPFRYLLGLPVENKAYELAGLAPPADGVFQVDQLHSDLTGALASALAFDQAFTGGPQARLMQWNRTYYWNDTRTGPLALEGIGQLPLVHHTESACFNPGFIGDVYGGRVSPTMLRDEGRYTLTDDYWWQTSPTLHYRTADQFNLLSHQVNLDEGVTRYTYDEPYLLSLTGVIDAVGNEMEALIDYHLPAPYRIVDPNQNVSEVRYDPLGMVVGSTAYGDILSPTGTVESYGNEPLAAYTPQADESFERILAEPARFLQQAGAFFFYDLESWSRDSLPLSSIALAREEFVHDGQGGGTADSRIQIAVGYLDGFGRELQGKQRVEAGPAIYRDDHGDIVTRDGVPLLRQTEVRWRVSGHAVFNNKQQVVRQYEPFFSPASAFESDEEVETFGETTRSYYDPLGRLVRTDFPNGTMTRSEFSPWETRQYDPNDAVAGSAYELFRETRPDSDPEKQALRKAQAHRDTPIITHLDPLGREVVLLETSNSGLSRRTEIELDFTGEARTITDPRELTAFTYRRDMLGRTLHEHSLDSGDRWSFINALDQPLHMWDGAGVHQQLTYDHLGRVTTVQVEGDGHPSRVTERMAYGEDLTLTDAAQRNARGQLIRHHDPAGLLTFHRFEPGGNPLQYERRLLVESKVEANWTDLAAVDLEEERFETRLQVDALGRVKVQQLPDGTTRRFEFLLSGGVQQVRVTTTDGVLTDTPILRDTTYNARGQRTEAVLGNDVELSYTYDPETYRLDHLLAQRPSTAGGPPERVYQDIHYTYDPVGNVIHMIDLAQQARSDVIRNLDVSAHSDFTYDAFYQLTEAGGRIHESLQQHDYNSAREGQATWIKGTRHLSLNNGAAVKRYTRTYSYDLNGNMQRMDHRLHLPGGDTSRNWQTDFWISPNSNRSLPALDLNGIPIPDPESQFDANGNCLYLPHLRSFTWNYRSNLAQAVIIDRSATGQPNDAEYYVYGGDGQRVRKVTERLHSGGLQVTEKIYLDGCEIKRVTMDGTPVLERTTSHLSDGSQRLALLHQWTLDTRNQETDDVTAKPIHYQLSNHLGSTALELAEHGNVISYEEYFPYGDTAFMAGNDLRQIRLKDYRYSGKERDDVTGLYYFGFRYYAPWLGRWLSPDPIGAEDGLNLYQYVRNNPVNFTDPDGLQASNVPISDVRSVWAPSVPEPLLERLSPEQRQQVETHSGPIYFTLHGNEPFLDESFLDQIGNEQFIFVYLEGHQLTEVQRDFYEMAVTLSALDQIRPPQQSEEETGEGSEGSSETGNEGNAPEDQDNNGRESGNASSNDAGNSNEAGDRRGSNTEQNGEEKRNGQPNVRANNGVLGDEYRRGVRPGESEGVGDASSNGTGTQAGSTDPRGAPIGTLEGDVQTNPGPEEINSEEFRAGTIDGSQRGTPERHTDGMLHGLGEHEVERGDLNLIVEWYLFYLLFIGGVGYELVMGVVELALMLVDLVIMSYEVQATLLTGEPLFDYEPLSAIGQAAYEGDPADVYGMMWEGLIGTPDRLMDAFLSADSFALGQETLAIAGMAEGGAGVAGLIAKTGMTLGRGIRRGATRVGSMLRKYRSGGRPPAGDPTSTEIVRPEHWRSTTDWHSNQSRRPDVWDPEEILRRVSEINKKKKIKKIPPYSGRVSPVLLALEDLRYIDIATGGRVFRHGLRVIEALLSKGSPAVLARVGVEITTEELSLLKNWLRTRNSRNR